MNEDPLVETNENLWREHANEENFARTLGKVLLDSPRRLLGSIC